MYQKMLLKSIFYGYSKAILCMTNLRGFTRKPTNPKTKNYLLVKPWVKQQFSNFFVKKFGKN